MGRAIAKKATTTVTTVRAYVQVDGESRRGLKMKTTKAPVSVVRRLVVRASVAASRTRGIAEPEIKCGTITNTEAGIGKGGRRSLQLQRKPSADTIVRRRESDAIRHGEQQKVRREVANMENVGDRGSEV